MFVKTVYKQYARGENSSSNFIFKELFDYLRVGRIGQMVFMVKIFMMQFAKEKKQRFFKKKFYLI